MVAIIRMLHTSAVRSIAVLFAMGWTGIPALAQCPHQGSSDHHAAGSAARPREDSVSPQGGPGRMALAYRPPHNGQVTKFMYLFFEVVHQPRETRVYLYGPGESPISAKDVQGQLVLRLRGQERVNRYPLHYGAPPAGSREQDYLAAAIDLSRVRDGDMTVAVDLGNLPHTKQKEAKFMQMFALSKPWAEPGACPAAKGLTIAPATAADAAAISAQQLCPVMNATLDEHGTPIKVSARDQDMFVCCRGCLARVQKNPDFYFAQAAQLRRGSKDR